MKRLQSNNCMLHKKQNSVMNNQVKVQVVNVNGTRFDVSEGKWAVMKKNVSRQNQEHLHQLDDEIYVERHPSAFQSILYFEQGGELHLPRDLCPSSFKKELKFWGVDEFSLAKCCFAKYVAYFDDQEVLKILESDENKRRSEKLQLRNMSSGARGWRRIQGRMWLTLNEPFYSKAAKVYFVFSAILITVSLFALIAGTHPVFQRPLNTKEWKQYFGDEWNLYKHHFVSEAESETEPETAVEPNAEVEPEATSELEVSAESESEAETKAEGDVTSEPETEEEPYPFPENAFSRYLFIDVIEFICIGLFTLDLLVRLIVCPYRYQLLFSFLNWVDIFALAVMYLKYTTETIYPKEKYEASVLDMLHCLQVVRIFRLFRLVKNFIGFRVLLYAFKASFKELMLMSLFLFVAMLLFSTFAFFSGDNSFPNIPDAFWWTIVTMTTVGYGDVVPKTPLSKSIGVFCAISGVCLIAVVIPIFVNNFMLFYNYSKVWGKKVENQNENRHVKITQVLAVEDLQS